MTNYLTPAAHAAAEAELAELRGAGRQQIRLAKREVQESARPEDMGYYEVLEAEGHIERRIEHLTKVLDRAVVTDAPPVSDTVVLGSTVELRYEGDEETETCKLSTFGENGEDLITPSSPLGQALDGAKPGDNVTFRSDAGFEITVEVVAVK